jgi:DNA-binding transcriptional MerR regulator|nr:MerR family transcriptional regulator [Kofleriaceae bacterium]
MFTVGELARLTGVTVRALHHYDEIGLVRPSARSDAGYRLYDDGDVLRLQQVLLFRELGMPLEAIASAIDDGGDRSELLRRHRDALVDKRARIDAMIAALDAALKETRVMTEHEVKKLFEGFDPAHYEAEAEARWGDTDAYKESARRTATYGKADWDRLQGAQAAIYARLAELMAGGAAATDPRVQEQVEAHRLHIDAAFYPCSVAMHKCLGATYVADDRFTANLDKVAPGFAAFLSAAIAAS